jgi:anti-sigma factor RsiW
VTTIVPPDDRISAYLDDNLSPAERDEVQQLLATSAPWRGELAEVSWSRATLRALPARVAPTDFFEQLLRDGPKEREERRESAPPKHSLGAAVPPGALPEPIPLRPRAQPRGVHRAVRWATGAAAAAAVLVAALLMPSRGTVAPPVPELADSHAVRSSVTDDPVMQLANIGAITPFGR